MKKWRPDDYWRIGEHESWFSDMAGEGLHLKDMGYRMAKFVDGEPKKTKYRIDIYQGEHTNDEQKEFYAESGWDFVTKYEEFNVYSSAEHLNAPELHTDPKEQSYTLKVLEDKMKALFFINVIGPIAMILIAYFIFIKDSNFYLALIDDLTWRFLIMLIIVSRGFYDSTRSFFAVKSLRKDLLEGKAIDHNAPWKDRNRKSKNISRTLFILSILILIFPLLSIIRYERNTLPVDSSNLPIVRLADIEHNPDLIRTERYYDDDKIDYANYYEYNWNLFAPVQYKTYESGVVPNKTWKYNADPYDPFIITNMYKLSIPSINKGIFNGIIKKEKVNNDGEFIEEKNPNFEKLVIYKHENFNEVIAYKGPVVMRVRYFGEQAVENIIRVMEDKINRIVD